MLPRLPAHENQGDRASESARQGSNAEEEERHCQHRGAISPVIWGAPNGDTEPAKDREMLESQEVKAGVLYDARGSGICTGQGKQTWPLTQTFAGGVPT